MDSITVIRIRSNGTGNSDVVNLITFYAGEMQGWKAVDITGHTATSFESREIAIVEWLRRFSDKFEESEAFYG